MKPLCDIHLEHALPVLAELGLDALVPLIGGQGFTRENIAGALAGLAQGAEKRALRHLVAIAGATGEELLAWEENPEAQARALTAAALLSVSEGKQAVLDFFTSFGPYLSSTHASSPQPKGEAGEAQGPAPSSAPVP